MIALIQSPTDAALGQAVVKSEHVPDGVSAVPLSKFYGRSTTFRPS